MRLFNYFQRRSKSVLPLLALLALFQAVVLTTPRIEHGAAPGAAAALTEIRDASPAVLG